MVEITDRVDATADLYWRALNEDNKISLLVKVIDNETGATEIRVAMKAYFLRSAFQMRAPAF